MVRTNATAFRLIDFVLADVVDISDIERKFAPQTAIRNPNTLLSNAY